MLHHIEIRNSIYFQEIMKIKTITVDLESYQGITLLTGENGFGKSSLLEFMVPYRKLPSRPGAYKKHFINECGSVSRVWTINDIKYEFLIKCNKNLTECYIYKIDENNNKISILNSTSTDAYDTAVEKICGPESIFFKTIFKNSNSNMGGLKESNKKEFFINLLGAVEYAGMKEISIKEKNKIKFDIDILDDSKKNIEEILRLDENQNIESQIKDTNDELVIIYDKIENISNEIKTINENNLKIANDSSKKTINESDIKNLNEKKDIINNEILDIENKINETIEDINNQNNLILKNNEFIKDLEDKVNKYRKRKSILVEKNELNEQKIKLTNVYNNNTTILSNIDNKKTIINNHKKELSNLELKLKDTEIELDIANKNKCEVDPALCKNSFIIDNLIENINNLINKISELKNSDIINNNNIIIEKLSKNLNFLNFKNNDDLLKYINDIEKKLELIPENIEIIVSELDLSSYKLIETKNKNFEIEDNIVKLNNTIPDLRDKKIEKEKLLHELNKDINLLVEELLELENIKHIDSKDKESEYKLLNLNKDDLLIKITKLQSIQENINKQKKELSIIDAKISKLNKKIVMYESVEDFCNTKDGMPILKLKIFGKLIQDRANRILDIFRRTGVDYQIEFITSKKDSTGKKDLDCFDIIVTNSEQKQIDLDSLSAGQQIIIEMALSLSASGENLADKFKVLLLDEADFALDSNNVSSLYRTLEIIKDDLEIDQIFIVTHNQQVQKTYPQKIKLTKKQEKYKNDILR